MYACTLLTAEINRFPRSGLPKPQRSLWRRARDVQELNDMILDRPRTCAHMTREMGAGIDGWLAWLGWLV